MKRPSTLIMALIFFAGRSAFAGENSAKDTIIYLGKLQTPSGAFLPATPKTGDPGTPTLRATTSALRALRYNGAPCPNLKGCIQFVESCFDQKSGGFADTPGGRPDVLTTAVGAMAVVELKMPPEKYADPAIRYLSENAKSFEDIRIAAAGLESLGKISTRNAQWLSEIRKMANADGTYGMGPGKARASGGAIALVLRLGGKVDDRDAVLAALSQGQRKTGGFGKEDAGDASDLETTYRVMRTYAMLKSQPSDVPALKAFIAKCRNPDGGYAVAPGQPSSASGTYFAAIIQHWLRKE